MVETQKKTGGYERSRNRGGVEFHENANRLLWAMDVKMNDVKDILQMIRKLRKSLKNYETCSWACLVVLEDIA